MKQNTKGKKFLWRKQEAGFSLVELLVVIFIVSLTAGILLVSYEDDRTAKVVEASGRELLGTLKEAQNYALTGKQLLDDTVPCGFEVRWEDDTSYSLVYYYRLSNSSACDVDILENSDSLVYTRSLRGGTQFTSGDSSVVFTLPHGVPVPTPTSGTALPIILGQGEAYHVVCIYAEGRLSDHSGLVCPS